MKTSLRPLISFAAKTASVDTGNTQRDDHLRSDGLLSTRNQFPELTFKANGNAEKI